MITATCNGYEYKIHGLINRGEWFGKTWLVCINIANALNPCFVVEADHEQDLVDAFADSSRSHLIDTDEMCEACVAGDYNNCECVMAGNDGHRVNLDYFNIIGRCKVNYFEPKHRRYDVIH